MNKTNGHCSSCRAERQQGIALITGLIFLVVLTLLGVTAARMAGLEERMSGNMRDRSLAMQAAEMTLRDAERDILGGAGITRNPRISGLANFDRNCTNGLCNNGTAGANSGTNWAVTPVWSIVSMTAAPSVAFGMNTGATLIPGLSAAPRYLIEGFMKNVSGGGAPVPFYRITVRAQGANPNTVVWLQEVFTPF